MTSRPKRRKKGTVAPGEGTAETAAPPHSAESPAGSSVEGFPADSAEAGAGSDAVLLATEATSAVNPAQALVPVAGSAGQDAGEAITPEELAQDEAVVDRVGHLAKDVGWVLVAAGVIGIVMPGVLGTPFLIAGAAALWPGNQKRLQRWREGHSPKFFHGSMKQINRFLDDLERRYPKNGKR
jgi:hypothetical protein